MSNSDAGAKCLEDYIRINRELENQNTLYSESITKLREQLRKATDDVDILQKLKIDREHLTARETEVAKRERHLEIEILKIQLAESEKRTDSLHDLIGQLFKSPIVRRAISTIDNNSEYYTNSGSHKYRVGSESTVTEIEE